MVYTFACGADLQLSLDGELRVLGTIHQAEQAPCPALQLNVEFWVTREERNTLKDGDSYNVRVELPGLADPLIDHSATAQYHDSYPKGRDCDGEDGYCRFASID